MCLYLYFVWELYIFETYKNIHCSTILVNASTFDFFSIFCNSFGLNNFSLYLFMYFTLNKIYCYLKFFLLVLRISVNTRKKASYNNDQELKYLQERADEDLGQLKDDNGGDASTDSKYNYNYFDNYDSIATSISIPRVQQNSEPVELVVQEEIPKKVRFEISLDTVLAITNFYEFDPPIPKKTF